MAADRPQHNAQANAELLQAALDSNIQGINRAVAMGADVDFTDAQGRFALSVAAAQHDMEVLDRLLQLNANPNTRGADGHTALYAAAALGHEDIVRRLLTWHMTDTEDMGDAAVLAERQGNLKLCARILAHLNREYSSCWRCAGYPTKVHAGALHASTGTLQETFSRVQGIQLRNHIAYVV